MDMPYRMLAIFLMQGTANHTFFVNGQRGTPGNALVVPVPARVGLADTDRHAFDPRRRDVLGAKVLHHGRVPGPCTRRHSHRGSGLEQAIHPP